ncbi:MAG: carboxylesterase [Nitrospira bacterium SG8_3]|nr:MAG: carboxylesterase [Nitrospira bacterium SG8_3]
MALLDSVEINPKSKPCASIIWLHGLGADGHDFEPIVPELRLPETLPIRFIFPHAPRRPVTVNAGVIMRAWYDVLGMPGSGGIELAEFFESVDHLDALIEKEMESGMPSERILLAGFSQGGAISLHTGLTYGKHLAGILALSTYLPTADKLAEQTSLVNKDIPIMMAHGTMDPVIPMAHALRTKHALRRLGYEIIWHEYPIMHGVCAEEIRDITAWLLKIFHHESGL